MTVIALIPAFNEAERITATVAAARSVYEIDRVVVVDDGSADDTARLAAAAGSEVIRLETNRGKGAALNAGLEHIATDADVLVLLDADLASTAQHASLLVRPVLDGRADMTVAILPRPAGSGGLGLVKGLARRGIRRLGGLETAAPLSGQRALSRAAWRAGTPFAAGYGVEVALTIRVLRAGLRVAEVPTSMGHAATGKTLAGFAHRGRQFVAVAFTLARLGRERQSPRVIGGK